MSRASSPQCENKAVFTFGEVDISETQGDQSAANTSICHRLYSLSESLFSLLVYFVCGISCFSLLI